MGVDQRRCEYQWRDPTTQAAHHEIPGRTTSPMARWSLSRSGAPAALTKSRVITDDARIVHWNIRKVWGIPGADITIQEEV